MSINIVEDKLKQYSLQTKQEELNALKEIFQEIALAALSRGKFFKQAAFQGGTCLRIVYGIQRFSEDLDFILVSPEIHFEWTNILNMLKTEFLAYDITIEALDRPSEKTVKTAFIKSDSLGKILSLQFKRDRSDIQKIQIKLEIDTHPPTGSEFETKLLDFPFPYTLTTQDLKSLFASKCHALLYRPYNKGRDWYDFIWYISKKTPINFKFLQNAARQSEKNPNFFLEKNTLIEKLLEKIENIDWNQAKNDIFRFLRPEEARTLNLWNKSFFIQCVEKMNLYLE